MWWTRYPERMKQEVVVLTRHYPAVHFAMIKNSSARCPNCSDGTRESQHMAVFADIPTFRGNHFPVAVIYPCNFPERIPVAWFLRTLDPPPNVHFFASGRPCLTANEFDSSVTGAIVLGWTHDWLKAYEIWRKTGHFPDGNFGRVRVR